MSSKTFQPRNKNRYYDLDWLRVFATIVVFMFHAMKPFLGEPWHIQNMEVSPALQTIAGLVDFWMMPLLFVISGMSIALSLRRRSAWDFCRERFSRLVVPFSFGVLVLAPLQVYIERLNFQQFQGSFIQFLPHAFEGLYLEYGGSGNFAWMGLHLWYLGLLFVFSIFLLPIFLCFSQPQRKGLILNIGRCLQRPFGVILAALPLMLLSMLNPTGLGWRKLGSWNLPVYLALLFYGFFFIQTRHQDQPVYRNRWLPLIIGMASGLIAAKLDGSPFGTVAFFVGQAARALVMWCVIYLFFIIFRPLRRRNSRFLAYTSDLVLPFYILHQPVIIFAGYFWVLQLDLSPLHKFTLLASLSLVIVLLTYELLVRRANPLRRLFGLKTVQHPVRYKAKAIIYEHRSV